ncbi:N-acetylmuramoyl-L-alanine amidase [Bacillus sp. N5-665]|uniref:N-acetylmuramoyl-L-alanine amidase (Endolysin) (Cell wall hydrolase) n=1 Tax=Bacillus wiedmannii TaxID=1890302 RepID=A0AB37YU93_9BACI|nr:MULTISPECIES: N-acetylmuramoyl-L-alanine amidase C-terminal domain-containing protein [Bacillus]PEJ40050.1 N-acetylmuramoyl-L-alanine amidase [Bacillus wiedmannii]UNK31265.1 N-acetylmuramoyl-L-alanine amidase [Bacillus sp. N5-665]SCC45833.1 N-acetylmuramoyl-L-alanine amidase (Endolysin) (Cell wall hydrolase) [Bacillus wiedmannii]
MKVSSHRGHNAIVPGANYGGRKEHLLGDQTNGEFIRKLRALGHSVEDDTDNVGRTASAVVGNQVRNINDRPNDVGFAWHNNASDGNGHGVEVLCYSEKEAPMAARISAEIAKRTGWKDRGAKIRPDVGVIRSSNCPFFLIEAGFIDNDGDMAKWNVDAITSAVIFAYFVQETRGGSQNVATPPAKQNIIQTGAFSPYEVQDAMQALTSVKMTATFILQSDGLTFFVSEPTSDTQLNAMKGYLDRKGWWYEVK